VVTTLHNFAMPLIRYEIGDYAEVGKPCECGRGLPVLNRILGRQRNMLVFPDGEKRWPVFGINDLAQDLPFVQYQFIQKKPNLLEARLVVERILNKDEEARFINSVHQYLNYPFSIEFTYLDNIPRSKGGKFEDFISEVT
jgi:phenylacetate-CoA ligase